MKSFSSSACHRDVRVARDRLSVLDHRDQRQVTRSLHRRPSVRALESDTTMQAFDEQQGVTLGSDVSVDITPVRTTTLRTDAGRSGRNAREQPVRARPVDHHSVQLEGTIR